MRLGDTNNYYMSSNFHKYDDTSLKGKLFVIISPSGKAMDILFRKGTKDISKLEGEIIELLEKIEM